MKKRFLLVALFLISPLLLVAGEGEGSRYLAQTGREYDFFPRVVDFLIFAGLLYYLLADPIKNFFENRSKAIEKELQEIEEKVQEAKKAQESAKAKLKESEIKAKEIVEDAKKEALLISKKIKEQTQEELKIMEKMFEEKCLLEQREAIRESIDKILRENIDLKDIALDSKKIAQIVSKKVA